MSRRQEETKDYRFLDQKILDVDMGKEVRTSFIQYSMSVITSRALPDVRDGLKPVHRRILYAMYEDHLTYDKPYRKSATTVGNVLGRYHPHGDSAVYDSMVRLAQPFSLRYTLIDGQGNFGNIDGDQAAAYRYTEARMSKMANLMLEDIEKDVVDFAPNFDNKLKEPTVLPSRFPNILVNGSVGIAVGMATNIPTHNLGEVVDATICLMENPEATVQELMQHLKGPDFPTGATIYGSNGIVQAYSTGRGRVMVRSKAEIDEANRRIIVTEIPYMVNKVTLVSQIAGLVKDKRVDGITALRDETDKKKGIRIVIEYRRDVNGQIILNQLYKNTQLQDTCAINMLALVKGEPKILSLKEILNHYIDHQESVIIRRVNFDLKKAEHEAHIREGQKIAIDHIDEVINIIRGSASIPDAKAKLMERFGLTDIQAQAIVEMTLGRLSGMERDKIEARLNELYDMIKEFKAILADENRIKQIIKDELLEAKKKFGDERKTEIIEAEDDILIEDLIEKHTCLVTMSNAGYIKRCPSDTYSAQRRGGKGIIGMSTKDEDFVETVVACHSHSYLMMFTNKGKVQVKKAYQIPEAGRTAKGTNIVNILELDEGEKVTALLSIPEFVAGEYLTMVTKNGVIKRTDLSEYEYQRKGGKKALNLDEDDELVFVAHTTGENEVIIATYNGYAARFHESAARVMGRTARGVRGIKLTEGDYVKAVAIVEEGKKLVSITEKGFGKRCEYDDFSAHNRGTKGVCCHKLSAKTGKLCGIASVAEDEDVMMITSEGTMIRIAVSDIPVYSRTAGGVIVMRTGADTHIVNFAKVAKEPEEIPEIEAPAETAETAEATVETDEE
ncbi:MAG: DNA gyrase subunit A [Clostridia bacterium]|nr:DNA gyrase subunit A [Clostridia bacterium]